MPVKKHVVAISMRGAATKIVAAKQTYLSAKTSTLFCSVPPLCGTSGTRISAKIAALFCSVPWNEWNERNRWNKNIVSPSAGFSVKYNPDHWSVSAGARTAGRIARYSLNPKANLNTLDTRFTASGTYTTKHEFEFNSDIAYVFYKGYAAGYGQPEWQWNAEISKNIGAFNLSVKVHDILNQTRNLTHTVTANYEEDSYRLIMGRYILFGVKWNFGKMNAAHSARAQQAAFNMVF